MEQHLKDLGKVTLTMNGFWDRDVTYERLCCVNHNGTSYISRHDDVTTEPIAGGDIHWHEIVNLSDVMTKIENIRQLLIELGKIVDRIDGRLIEVERWKTETTTWIEETTNIIYGSGGILERITNLEVSVVNIEGEISTIQQNIHHIVQWLGGSINDKGEIQLPFDTLQDLIDDRLRVIEDAIDSIIDRLDEVEKWLDRLKSDVILSFDLSLKKGVNKIPYKYQFDTFYQFVGAIKTILADGTPVSHRLHDGWRFDLYDVVNDYQYINGRAITDNKTTYKSNGCTISVPCDCICHFSVTRSAGILKDGNWTNDYQLEDVEYTKFPEEYKQVPIPNPTDTSVIDDPTISFEQFGIKGIEGAPIATAILVVVGHNSEKLNIIPYLTTTDVNINGTIQNADASYTLKTAIPFQENEFVGGITFKAGSEHPMAVSSVYGKSRISTSLNAKPTRMFIGTGHNITLNNIKYRGAVKPPYLNLPNDYLYYTYFVLDIDAYWKHRQSGFLGSAYPGIDLNPYPAGNANVLAYTNNRNFGFSSGLFNKTQAFESGKVYFTLKAGKRDVDGETDFNKQVGVGLYCINKAWNVNHNSPRSTSVTVSDSVIIPDGTPHAFPVRYSLSQDDDNKNNQINELIPFGKFRDKLKVIDLTICNKDGAGDSTFFTFGSWIRGYGDSEFITRNPVQFVKQSRYDQTMSYCIGKPSTLNEWGKYVTQNN